MSYYTEKKVFRVIPTLFKKDLVTRKRDSSVSEILTFWHRVLNFFDTWDKSLNFFGLGTPPYPPIGPPHRKSSKIMKMLLKNHSKFAAKKTWFRDGFLDLPVEMFVLAQVKAFDYRLLAHNTRFVPMLGQAIGVELPLQGRCGRGSVEVEVVRMLS